MLFQKLKSSGNSISDQLSNEKGLASRKSKTKTNSIQTLVQLYVNFIILSVDWFLMRQNVDFFFEFFFIYAKCQISQQKIKFLTNIEFEIEVIHDFVSVQRKNNSDKVFKFFVCLMYWQEVLILLSDILFLLVFLLGTAPVLL
jgi:hypothetical protein